MNGEIKFRIWDKDIISFIYTDKYIENKIGEEDFCIGADFKSYSFNGGRNWSNGIFQQFTGLEDINGREIYEGDILDFGNEDICYVIWNTDSSAWGFNDELLFNGLAVEEGKVVGNIFENPKFLNK
jgi:hypothetical protein